MSEMSYNLVKEDADKKVAEIIEEIRGVLILMATHPEQVEAMAFHVQVKDGRLVGGEVDQVVYAYSVGTNYNICGMLVETMEYLTFGEEN